MSKRIRRLWKWMRGRSRAVDVLERIDLLRRQCNNEAMLVKSDAKLLGRALRRWDRADKARRAVSRMVYGDPRRVWEKV